MKGDAMLIRFVRSWHAGWYLMKTNGNVLEAFGWLKIAVSAEDFFFVFLVLQQMKDVNSNKLKKVLVGGWWYEEIGIVLLLLSSLLVDLVLISNKGSPNTLEPRAQLMDCYRITLYHIQSPELYWKLTNTFEPFTHNINKTSSAPSPGHLPFPLTFVGHKILRTHIFLLW